MKIAIILLSCLVGLSYPQRFFLPSWTSPMAAYIPRFYGQPSYEIPTDLNEVDAEVQTEPEVYGRNRMAASPPQPRLFQLFGFFPFGGFGNIVTWSYTSWTTTTATATTAMLQYCIPVASFAQVGGINYQQGGNFQGAGSQPATAYCNRRKRAAFFDQLELSELIAPSETRPVEASAVPELADKEKREALAFHHQPQLVSSKDDEPEHQLAEQPRYPRQLGLVRTFTQTVYSTATSYTFSSTVYKQTIRIGSSLQCLPIGFAVC